MTLDEYSRKRNFRSSTEPRPDTLPKSNDPEPDSPNKPRRFVVQKHNATKLHYDFRLEIDGVLKSWAVPRGPSLNPKSKRLAIQTEDHPLSYASFEGVIPAGDYGGGTVIVWDRGTWEMIADTDPLAALSQGRITFELFGERLRGKWMLVETRQSGKQTHWLLVKERDEHASGVVGITETYTSSIASGETIHSVGNIPNFIEPQLPSLTKHAPQGNTWLHELKLDGYRIQARWSHGSVRLLTRQGLDWTDRYSNLAERLGKLQIDAAILDGELVAVDAEGRTVFEGLKHRHRSSELRIAYFAFDLLHRNGNDMRHLPLVERKSQLQALIKLVRRTTKLDDLQYVDYLSNDPKSLVDRCRELGLEGIVSKRSDRPYISGRSQDWLKLKLRYRESLVVGGMETDQNQATLASLLLGYYHDNRQFIFAGRVGTGWNDKTSRQLIDQLQPLQTTTSPFVNSPPAKRKKAGTTSTKWLHPVKVVEVQFANWTDARQLRHASYVSLDPETSADEVAGQRLFADRDSGDTRSQSGDASLSRDRSNHTPTTKRPTTKIAPDTPGLTNHDRVLYPDDGITKADVATYLYQVNQWMLPHLADRPLTLLRAPSGLGEATHYQRHPNKGFPEQIDRREVLDHEKPLILVSDLESLLATAQISAIELHPWGSRIDRLERPDRMIIDLDPDTSIPWSRVVDAAFLVRDELQRRNLLSFVKTTGGKGLHIIVPIDRRYDWNTVFGYSKQVAEYLVNQFDQWFVATMSKSKRKQRIYLDYHRNREGATAIAPYSLRARNRATVATPIEWDELRDIDPMQLTLHTVPTRLMAMKSDPWESLASTRQRLVGA